jgi:hypothetical protein
MELDFALLVWIINFYFFYFLNIHSRCWFDLLVLTYPCCHYYLSKTQSQLNVLVFMPIDRSLSILNGKFAHCLTCKEMGPFVERRRRWRPNSCHLHGKSQSEFSLKRFTGGSLSSLNKIILVKAPQKIWVSFVYKISPSCVLQVACKYTYYNA